MHLVVAILRGLLYVVLYALQPVVVALCWIGSSLSLVGGGLVYLLDGPKDGAFLTLGLGIGLAIIAGIYRPIVQALEPAVQEPFPAC